ncbi:hypothetical protein D8674_005249 [Pyrus ussuriensis x Pyrus communis]|uniref:Uncharacterized protein n=1 Tax=Pyrus ussuriensis x Pyrus communis TaxID=2448454 RepID=A0A5N5FWK9_9ROSA|nr:hypothetical protein D8674_005249 [Pyrus ussuriensis x Pyrus communis]
MPSSRGKKIGGSNYPLHEATINVRQLATQCSDEVTVLQQGGENHHVQQCLVSQVNVANGSMPRCPTSVLQEAVMCLEDLVQLMMVSYIPVGGPIFCIRPLED